jgi:MinD-like ATPase involved in chromosome partitioning or flagellar assembly
LADSTKYIDAIYEGSEGIGMLAGDSPSDTFLQYKLESYIATVEI